jgi:hypothetical protein
MSELRFCVEDAAIYENHQDSWIVKYLEEHGFSNLYPDDTLHRVGPWLWVDVENMTYRYHPHYGVGCGQPLFGITITGKDLRTIIEILDRRKKLHAETGIKWSVRISIDNKRKSDGNDRSTKNT